MAEKTQANTNSPNERLRAYANKITQAGKSDRVNYRSFAESAYGTDSQELDAARRYQAAHPKLYFGTDYSSESLDANHPVKVDRRYGRDAGTRPHGDTIYIGNKMNAVERGMALAHESQHLLAPEKNREIMDSKKYSPEEKYKDKRLFPDYVRKSYRQEKLIDSKSQLTGDGYMENALELGQQLSEVNRLYHLTRQSGVGATHNAADVIAALQNLNSNLNKSDVLAVFSKLGLPSPEKALATKASTADPTLIKQLFPQAVSLAADLDLQGQIVNELQSHYLAAVKNGANSIKPHADIKKKLDEARTLYRGKIEYLVLHGPGFASNSSSNLKDPIV